MNAVNLLIVVCLSSTAVFTSSIPVLYTRGTHYEVGRDMGETFQKQIQGYFSHHEWLQNYFLPWYNTPEGRKIYNGYLSIAQSDYPQYIEELQGVADGANISFNKVFLVNIDVELGALLKLTTKVESCTDIFVQHPASKQTLLGHNEDGDESVKTRGYIVHAEVMQGDEGRKVLMESFTAYTYPGKLPGNAFGFNRAGLIFTANALYPTLVLTNKTCRSFLTRAILSAHNVRDAATIINDSGRGAAYGFSLNIGSLREQSGGKRQLWNWEVYPNTNGTQSIVDFLLLNMQPTNATNYFHVNTYRRIKVAERPSHVTSSHHRSQRIKSIASPQSPSDVLGVLGDTKDALYPIYRNPSPTDNGCTVATALFDMVQCTCDIYKRNPKHGHAPLHTFRLPC